MRVFFCVACNFCIIQSIKKVTMGIPSQLRPYSRGVLSLEHAYPSPAIGRHRYRSGRYDHLNLVRRLHFEHVRKSCDRATTPPPPPSAIGISSVVVVVIVIVVVVVVVVVFRPEVMEINRRGCGGSVGNE